MLKKDKSAAPPEWFQIQYENLPFFCFSCGLIGHFESGCPTLQSRDEAGKLPYEFKMLWAPDDRKRRPPSFAQAAAESFGSSSGSGRRKSTDIPMQKRQGTWKDPFHSQPGEGEGSGDGVSSSQSGRGVAQIGKEKAQDRQVAHFVARKRKGMNAKNQEPSLSALLIQSSVF
jgi:hypothetical protein